MNQSNSNNKKRNRKKRNSKPKPQPNANGYQDKKLQNENPSFNGVNNEYKKVASPRPTDLKRNSFQTEIKRCSGSEVEEFHTPSNEYPSLSNQECTGSPDNFYDSQWSELASFNKSNLEEIPEIFNVNNRSNHFHCYNNQQNGTENISSHSFRYRETRTKKNKNRHDKDKADKNKMINQYPNELTNSNIIENVNGNHKLELKVEVEKELKPQSQNLEGVTEDNSCEVYKINRTKREVQITENNQVEVKYDVKDSILNDNAIIHVIRSKTITTTELSVDNVCEDATENQIQYEENKLPINEESKSPEESLNDDINLKEVHYKCCESETIGDNSNFPELNGDETFYSCSSLLEVIKHIQENDNQPNQDEMNDNYHENEKEKDEANNDIDEILLDDTAASETETNNVNEEENKNDEANNDLNDVLWNDTAASETEANNVHEEESKNDEANNENTDVSLNDRASSEKEYNICDDINEIIGIEITYQENLCFDDKDLELESICPNNDKNDIDLEDIPYTDENLEDETLPFSRTRLEIRYKYDVAKSKTFTVRESEIFLQQSNTTITNVTSISDENLSSNFNYDKKQIKNDKKSKTFLLNLMSKFKKRKTKPKTAEEENPIIVNEDQLAENNEYFDDTSIDCNSNTKGLEIDSNKALKSYDESINNVGDVKQTTEEDSFELKSENFNNYEIIEDNYASESPNIIKSGSISDDISKDDKDSPKKSPEDCDTKPEQSHSDEMSKPNDFVTSSEKKERKEKSKRKKIFNFITNKKKTNSPKNENVPMKERFTEAHLSDETEEEEIIIDQINDEIILEINNKEYLSNEDNEENNATFDTNDHIESLDRSFKFLKDFEKDSVKENDEKECVDSYDTATALKSTTCEENVNISPEHAESHLIKEDKTLIETVEDPSNKTSNTNNLQTPNEKIRKKHKHKFLTQLFRKSIKQITPKTRTKSLTNINVEDEVKIENGLTIELDQKPLKDFDDVVNSLLPISPEPEDKVICKNKNEYTLKTAETNLITTEVSFINDDHLFPDAITPSKIIQFDEAKFYNVPFIDDPIIIAQDSSTMFKGENKIIVHLTEFFAPFASSETLFISDQSYSHTSPQKSTSPIRHLKKPLTGLISLITRIR